MVSVAIVIFAALPNTVKLYSPAVNVIVPLLLDINVLISYCEVPPVRRLVSDGFNIIDSIVKLFELVPPSIVAPVPATIDNVGLNPYPLVVDQLSGGILNNLNPLILVVDVTINLLVLEILVLIKSPVVA